MSAEEIQRLTEKHNLTKEYLRRALLKLKKSTQFFDIEIDEVDEYEEEITKFIGEVKRKNLI
jgi:pimeloyl-CoA synthetase